MNRARDETSEALLEAAHQLLAEHGAEALTVRRIATEAGMSTMNVYSRFGGKDGVIDELYIDGHRRLMAAIAAVPSTDDVRGDLINCAEAYRDFAQSNPTYYGIMFGRAVNGFDPSAAAADFAVGALAGLVERIEDGQRLGVICEHEGCTPTAIAGWLWASCHGLVSLELDGIAAATIDWASTFRNGTRTALNGLHPSVSAEQQ